MIRRLHHHHHDEDGAEDEVNLSPLIDITFLLLIFFVVTSTFTKDAEVEIQRPGAATATTTRPDPVVRVALDAQGRTYVDGQRVQAWVVQSRVRDQLRRAKATQALVIADRRADAGQLVNLIDQCRQAGATRVAIAAQEGTP